MSAPSRRSLLWLAALAWLTGDPGCVPSPSTFDWPAGRAQKLLTSTPKTPAERLERGWGRLVRLNDLSGALQDLEDAAASLEPKESRKRMLASLGAGFILIFTADFPSALESFMAAVEADPRSPESLVAAVQLREVAHQVEDGHRRIEKRLQALLDSGADLGPELSRVLRLTLKEGFLRCGKWEAAVGLEQQLGVPREWRTSYPYGRHPLLDFDSRFPPESQPLPGRPRAPVARARPENGLLVLEQRGKDGLLYADSYFQVKCQAEADCVRQLSLRLEGVGSWAVFLDDVVLDVHDAHRRSLGRVVHLPFAGKSGWHRLLLKLPLRSPKTTIGVELTLADGRPAPIDWWTADRHPPPYPAGHQTNRPVLTQTRHRLRSRLEGHPDDPVSAALAALLEWEDGYLGEARRLLNQALRRAPEFAMAHYLMSLILLDDPGTPRRIDAARSREPLERALDLCPNFLLARFRLALLDREDGRETKALEALERLVMLRPPAALFHYFQGLTLEKLGWEGEADSAFQTALKLLPDHPETLRRLFLRAMKNLAGSEAARLAERRERLGHWSLRMVEFWAAREQPDRARSLLEKMIQRFPGRLPPRLALFDLLTNQGLMSDAERVITEAERLSLRNPEVLRRLANLLDRQKKPAEAQRLLARLVETTPWDLRARLALSAAAGGGGICLVGDRRFDARELIQRYTQANFRQDGNSVLVLDQTAIQVAPDCSSLERVHLIVHILTPKGLEQWGEVGEIPPGALVDQVRTITQDGKVFDAEVIPGKDTISLPALQVGDFVELSYLQGHPASTVVGSVGYAARRWYFRAPDMPIFQSEYSVAVPGEIALQIDAQGVVPAPSRHQENGFEVYRWVQHASPMTQSEPNAPPPDEYTPQLQVGFGLEWKDYRDQLRVELDEATRPNPDLADFADGVGSDAPNARERLRHLFRAVCTKVRQAGPAHELGEPASHILARREGNRLVLLVGLLRILGYRPRVFLVRTVTDSQIEYRFPNLTTYGHGLLSVEIGDNQETVWMDPTERYNAFGELYPFLWGMQAIEVTSPPGNHPFFRIPDRPTALPNRSITLDLSLSGDGTLTGVGREHIRLAQAANYRELLSSLSQQQRRQVMETGLGNYFSGAILESYRIVALSDPSQPLFLEYHFRVPAFASRRGNTLVIPGGFYSYHLGPSLATRRQRTLPLLLGDETRTSTRVKLSLPAGSEAILTEAVNLVAPLSWFSFSSRMEGNRLVIEKSLLVKAGRISPADYPAFHNFCLQVDRKDNQETVIRLAQKSSDRS